MRRIGYRYFIEGEYREHGEDDWKLFETEDIHPAQRDEFVVWSTWKNPDAKELERMNNQAIAVVTWMLNEWMGYAGLEATLWRRGNGDTRVMQWNQA